MPEIELIEYEDLDKVPDYDHQLAEDIIDNNCIDCPEFYKPLNKSDCWCDPIHELVYDELCRIDHCTENDEDAIGTEWESIRKKILRELCVKK